MDSNGQLIVIEGIDGAGKTTVCNQLCEDFHCSYMTQPEDSWVGEAARRALGEDVEPACDLFLHMAAHANQQPRIKSNLENSNVVMDRYLHSRVAYQSVQSRFSASQIEEMHLDWSVKPTTVVVLDIDPEEALKRKNSGGDKFEKIEFLSKVRSVYLEYFKDRDNTVVVDASKPKSEVLNEVKGHL